MWLFWLGLALMFSVGVLVLLIAVLIAVRVLHLYLPRAERIFQEKPLFIVPRGQPIDGAEVVQLTSHDGLKLRGCYLKSKKQPRRGVILFGLEFGSDCWSCWGYVEELVNNGFDVFAVEHRNQGSSDCLPGYEPLQWVTDYEVADTRTAIEYLKQRADADLHGIGLFGISRGAGAGVVAGSNDPYVRCFVTDGMFGTRTTVVPYMKHWFKIYNNIIPPILLPIWVLRGLLWLALFRVGRARNCRYSSVEKAMAAIGDRPLLMIHGEKDTYIKPDMARSLFDLGGRRPSHAFWLVENAKHNQALHQAGPEYHRRVLVFFEQSLVRPVSSAVVAVHPAPTRIESIVEEPDNDKQTTTAPVLGYSTRQ